MEKVNIRKTLLFAAGFTTWIIGSGFATGQEILRFFSAFGYEGYLGILGNLLGFFAIGYILCRDGYRHRKEKDYNHFVHYCGKTLGTFYTVATPALLFPALGVLLSASGTALYEYYGVNRHLGSALMALGVYGTYYIGFQRFLKITEKTSPLVVAFVAVIALGATAKGVGALWEIPRHPIPLEGAKAAPSWVQSAIVYLSLSFISGSSYYTNLGKAGPGEREVKYGVILGSVVILSAVALMNTAILLNCENTSALAIPTLYLAKSISPYLGGAFSVILILGLYSSSSATLWTVAHDLKREEKGKNRVLAGLLTVVAYLISLLSFPSLVAVLFPFIGYYGLPFNLCVLGGEFKRRQGERS